MHLQSSRVRPVTPDQRELGPTESDTGCRWVLLRSGYNQQILLTATWHGTDS